MVLMILGLTDCTGRGNDGTGTGVYSTGTAGDGIGNGTGGT